MKKIFFSIFLLGILLLAGAGCQTAGEKEIAAASQIVEIYMKRTLGRIPGAQIDYETAKKYLTDDLAAQFFGPGFAPASYCIQDGPTEVAIKSTEIFADKTAVKVDAKFGEEWQKKWEFILVKERGEWKISKINCL